MEDVLEIYHLPYDPAYPVVCMDESNKQMIGELKKPIPCAPRQPERIDHEYVRNGGGDIYGSGAPGRGKKAVAIMERRTRKDWAMQIKQMLDNVTPRRLRSVWLWKI